MKKWAKNYEELILKSTEYSGSREPNAKVLSASSINKENYYLMNQYNFEKKKQDSFGANTIGSIFQLGIDAAIQKHDKEGRYEFGRRMTLPLDNGWTISGELDVFDKIENVIIDNKVVSDYAMKDINKNTPDSDYNLQVATYVMLDHMNKSEEDMLRGKVHQEPATGALAIVNKGGSAVKNNIYTTLELNMYSPEDMIFMYQEKAKELQHYIDTNTMPEEVCDTAKFGMEKGVPKRCMLYCDFRDVCPNYSKYKKLTDRKIAEGLNSNIEKEKSVYIKPMEF